MRKHDIVMTIIIVLISILVFGGYYTCPMIRLFKVSCPGCGMTRAYISLLQGDIMKAMYYHPLFILPPIIIVMIVLDSRMNHRIHNTIMVICLILFLGVYLYRLFVPGTLISIIK